MRNEIAGPGYSNRAQRTLTLTGRVLEALHIDNALLLSLLAVCVAGLVVLFSAAGENLAIFFGQAARVGLGLGVMTAIAQVPPRVMRIGAPFLYGVGVLLLMAIMSWVSQGRSPVEYVLMQLADPLLRPIRNLLPSMGGIDFSPMVLVLLLYVINMGIAEVLQATGNVLLPGLWMAL